MRAPAKVAVPGQVCPHCGLNTLSFMAWAGRNAALYHCCAPHCGRIVRVNLKDGREAKTRERVAEMKLEWVR